MMSSAKNYPVSWFGVAKLPNLVPANETLFDVFKETHEVLATSLMVLAVLHVLAALQHHVLRRDDILRRMLPFTGPGTKHGPAKLALTAAAAILVSWMTFRMLQPGTTTETALIPGARQAPGEVTAPGAAVTDAGRAPGAAWTTDTVASALGFHFVQAGAETEGSFGSFTANIDFTPLPAPAGRFDVTIDVAGVDTHDKDRNEQLKSADLFDVARFPTARYVATSFAAKGAGFEARGTLTLRGVTHDVPLAFTWTPAADGKSTTLQGSANLKRLEFGVGQGEWKSTEWVADEVKVTFSLSLVPAAANR
jgi:polyisoprenoid-binding protein YceI